MLEMEMVEVACLGKQDFLLPIVQLTTGMEPGEQLELLETLKF